MVEKKILFLCFVVGFALTSTDSIAQKKYIGDPVKKSSLIRVLKSKKYRTKDIIEIIQEDGVDFRVTPQVKNQLISAGARPSLVKAVRDNYRGFDKNNGNIGRKGKLNSYRHFLDKAIDLIDKEKTAAAIDTLKSAVELDPTKSIAYQLLGFEYLYGYEDFSEAEKYMRESINRGGSAVFRVRHAHDVSFVRSCIGSLYISSEGVRYEGDDNEHTFDVRKDEIKKAKKLGGWGKLIRIKSSAFEIVIPDSKRTKTKKKKKKKKFKKYKFSPFTGEKRERKMILKLIPRK